MDPSAHPNRWTLGLVLVGLVGILLLSPDYGVTWDESIQSTYGDLVVDYFASGFHDTAANDLANLRYYGPSFEALASLAVRITGWPPAAVRHFLVGLTGLLTLLGLMQFARGFRDPWLPVFAVVALATLPRFFGHAFNNSKDIPYACFFVWSLVAIGRIVRTRSLRWRDALAAGGALGLAFSVRAGGMVLFAYLAVGLVLARLGDGQRGPGWRPGQAIPRLLALGAVAWGIMVALWPWAHENPLLNPLRAFRQATAFANVYPQLFEGRMIPSDQLPWYYLPKYLAITTPPATLLLSAWGLWLSVRRQKAAPRGAESGLWLLVQLWLFVPLVYVVVLRPNIYNGVRHFLFVLPAVALLAGLGATGVARLAARLPVRRWAPAVPLVLLLLPVPSLVALHPYQMTYFNALAGGVAEASRRYETDYWATSYREAALWVNDHPRPGPDGKTVVVVAANSYCRRSFEYYLDPDIESHAIWDEGDPVPARFAYFVGMTHLGTDRTFPEMPIVHEVGRQGAVFAVIRGW